MLPFPYEMDKPLSEVCTLGIGGLARYFTEVRSKQQLQSILVYCSQQGMPFIIIGKGSNCLFDDRGYGGIVIQNKIDTLRQEDHLFFAGSGYSFARLGTQTARDGWTGLEFAAGIPATVGGAIFMNAGASKQEIAEVIKGVEYLDEKGNSVYLDRANMQFGYRWSSFHSLRVAIVEGVFSLQRSSEAKMQQKTLLEYRLKTQPYGDKSAGCAFRNPLGHAAGQLIDQCGLKGMRVGGAEISNKHGNFIVNAGGATAKDVKELMQRIKEKIHLEKGILLEEEIREIPYEE